MYRKIEKGKKVKSKYYTFRTQVFVRLRGAIFKTTFLLFNIEFFKKKIFESSFTNQ